MKVYIQKTGQRKEIRHQGSVLALLYKLKLNPETVIVSRNSELVSEDYVLADTDDVEILQVVSGG